MWKEGSRGRERERGNIKDKKKEKERQRFEGRKGKEWTERLTPLVTRYAFIYFYSELYNFFT